MELNHKPNTFCHWREAVDDRYQPAAQGRPEFRSSAEAFRNPASLTARASPWFLVMLRTFKPDADHFVGGGSGGQTSVAVLACCWLVALMQLGERGFESSSRLVPDPLHFKRQLLLQIRRQVIRAGCREHCTIGTVPQETS